MRAVVFNGAGGNEVVAVEERADPVPGPGEVLVSVPFAGLNPADTIQRAGRYPAPPGSPPDIPGLEVAGRIVACGAGVATWKPGDRVFGIVGGGGLADRVVVHESHVTAVPDGLDDPGAAAVPEVFITAHDAIIGQAGLAAGETLLVHGGAGGVGTAAIQIGVDAGARVLATVRSDRSAEAVAAFGAEPVVDTGFAATVSEATGGAGADVILELVGAPHFPGNLEALALRGRIVVVGVGAGAETPVSLIGLMVKRASVRGTVLRPRSLAEKAAAVAAFARDVVPALAAGRVRPVVDSVYPLEQVTAAFDRLDGPGKVGKVLLEL